MSYSDLNLNYFFTKEGEKDKFVEMCANCIAQNVYLIMKNRINEEFDPFNLFLEDVTPLLIIKQARKELHIVNLLPFKPKFMDNVTFSVTVFENAPNVVAFLENQLDQGQLVLVQTAIQMLKYSIFYDPEYQMDERFVRNGHAILLLWYDDECFYFVENPVLVSPARCQYFNKEVIKIKKTEFDVALRNYTRSSTISINKNAFKNDHPNYDILERVVKNYSLQDDLDSGDELRFHGLNAIRKLIDICCHYDDYSDFELVWYGNLDRDVYRLIISRKEVFHQWLLKYSNSKSLCDSSMEVINSWNIAKSSYIKNILRRDKFPGIEESLKSNFENILLKEENFSKQLEEYLNSSSSIK